MITKEKMKDFEVTSSLKCPLNIKAMIIPQKRPAEFNGP